MHAVVEVGAWLLRRRRRFRVEGRSMVPTFQPDTFILIDPRRPVSIGDVVVAAHPAKPIDVIKRVSGIDGNRLDLRSDNPHEGRDSRHFGLVEASEIRGVYTHTLSSPGRHDGR